MRTMPSQAVSGDVTLDSPRCQFSFADGRRCRMPSAPPTLCLAHSKTQSLAVDLAPMSGEFRTATEINCALGKVFLQLAENRIPRRNAVALGYIAQLMLQTLPGVKEEFIASLGYQAWKDTLDDALQYEDEETEPVAESDSATEPEPEADEVHEVAVAVPLGTPISALAVCEAAAEPNSAARVHTETQPTSEAPIDQSTRTAVARVFSESAKANSEGPQAVAVPSGAPITTLASCSPNGTALASSENPAAAAHEQEPEPSPQPKKIGPAFPFVSWREGVGPGWVYWDNPEVIKKLDTMEAIRRLRWNE